MVKTGFLFLVFLLLSAFFSASETALTTLNRDRLLFLSRKGSKRAKNLAAFVAWRDQGPSAGTAATAAVTPEVRAELLQRQDARPTGGTMVSQDED